MKIKSFGQSFADKTHKKISFQVRNIICFNRLPFGRIHVDSAVKGLLVFSDGGLEVEHPAVDPLQPLTDNIPRYTADNEGKRLLIRI